MKKDKILEFLNPPGLGSKQLVIKNEYMTQFQKDLRGYQACYDGELFKDASRVHKWGTQIFMDLDITRDQWIPRFVPGIAKELVTTVSSYLTGKEKFPSVRMAAKVGFSKLPEAPPLSKGENPLPPEELEKQKTAKALSCFVQEVLEKSDFENQISQALDKALVKSESVLLINYNAGKFWLSHPDREWCTWEYSKNDPSELASFRESYFFTREGDKDSAGHPITYIFAREIDAVKWIESETPLISKQDGSVELGKTKEIYNEAHGFPFIPVEIFETVDKKSLYAGGVKDNIKGYIESYNDVHCGVFGNVRPQWVLLQDETSDGDYAAMPGESANAKKPLVPGRLWELRGKGIQSFSSQADSYQIGLDVLDRERADLRQEVSIIDIPPDVELSGVALMLKFGPQYASIDRWRVRVASPMSRTIKKLSYGAWVMRGSLRLDPNIAIPTTMEYDSMKVELDWGQIIPVTPGVIGEEINNAASAVRENLLSLDTAQDYTMAHFNVRDTQAEKAKIAMEKAERAEAQIQLADAAFKRMNKKENQAFQPEDLPNV